MNLWTYSLREAIRRPGRCLLTFLSIVVGVGTIFAISVTARSARSAFARMTETLSGKADAEIVAKGGGRFSRDLVKDVESDPAVRLAVPMLTQAVVIQGPKRMQITGVGTLLERERQMHPFEIVAGQLPKDEWEVLLEENIAVAAGLKPGDEIRLTMARIEPLRIAGLIRPQEIWGGIQGGLIYADLADWQWLCKAADKIDALQVVIDPALPREETLAALARKLPAELRLHGTRGAGEATNVTMIAFEHGLDMTQYLALAVAVLLILNTFMMNVTERRHQIAVLRLIGATRDQIMGLFLREGAVIGLAGALTGLPLGWYVAKLLAGAVEDAFGVTLQDPQAAWGPFVFALVLGPVVAMAAAFWPARKAGHIGPLESLAPRAAARVEPPGRLKIALGVVLLGVSAAGLSLAWVRLFPVALVIPCALTFLLSLLLTFPLVAAPACAAVHGLVRFLAPMECELTYRQLVRNVSRTRLTWGILFIAVAASVGTGLVLTDVMRDLRGDVQRTFLSDFIVRVSMPNMSTGKAAGLPDDVLPLVQKTAGVQSVEGVAFPAMKASASRTKGAAEDPDDEDLVGVVAFIRELGRTERLPFVPADNANPAEVRRRVLEGEIVVSEILAHKLGKRPGEDVKLTFAGKSVSVRIAASGPFFFAGGLMLFMDRQAAERRFGPLGTEALVIVADPGRRGEAEAKLRALCAERGLLFQTYADLQAAIGGIVSAVEASLWALLALGFLIAIFGVTNTLMMNVLEQTRALGLMRVLGMQRSQVRVMIALQSAYLGVLALVPGLAAGVILAFVVRSSTLAILGENPQFATLLPWLLPYAAALFLLVLLFGYLPAIRASRLDVLEAIRTE